jgi:hypothetical protein
MKINCLSCGHKIDLDNNAYSDYEGPIRCFVCGGRLEIKTEEGGIRSVKEVCSCAAEAMADNRLGNGQPTADR